MHPIQKADIVNAILAEREPDQIGADSKPRITSILDEVQQHIADKDWDQYHKRQAKRQDNECVVIFNPDWNSIFDELDVSDETVQNVVKRCHKYESLIILAELYDDTDLLVARPDG
jgi:hypothetical protein